MITDMDIGEIYAYLDGNDAIEALKCIIEATESDPTFDWDCRKKGYCPFALKLVHNFCKPLFIFGGDYVEEETRRRGYLAAFA